MYYAKLANPFASKIKDPVPAIIPGSVKNNDKKSNKDKTRST